MILLVVALVLIAGALLLKYGAVLLRFDRTMPSWLRGTLMCVAGIAVAGVVIYALAVV